MRLVDVDEVKKRYPIMENDFGMVINETLHKELDKIPTVEAISKANMIVILDKLKAEIEQEIIPRNSDQYDHEAMWQNCGLRIALKVIDKYRTESEADNL